MVFWEYLALHHLTGWEPAGAVVLSVLLAVASTYLLERPIRPVGAIVSGRTLFVSAAIASVCALAVGGALFASKGFPQRNRAAAAFGTQAGAERAALITSPCLAMDDAAHVPGSCQWGAASKGPQIILWGDSHGAQYATALHDALDPRGLAWRQMTKSGCPPIPTPILYPHDRLHRWCQGFDHEALADALSAPRGSLVILAARWDAVMSGQLGFANVAGKPSIANAEADLRAVLQALTAHGYEVVLLGQVPVPPQDAEGCLARAKFNRLIPTACEQFEQAANDQATAMDAATWTFVNAAAAGLDNVVLVRPWSDLCADGVCRMVGPDGALYLDATHLSEAGAKRILHHVQEALTAVHAPARLY